MNKNETKKKKPKSVYKLIFSFLIVSVISLFFARVVLSNILATSGQRLAAANQKIEQLKEENRRLENDISSLNSLEKIDTFAKDLGFIKTTQTQILVPQVPIASR